MKAFLLKALRNGLGQLVIFIDFITRPKKIKRSETAQQQVDEQSQLLSLYQFKACPFCVKVRRNLHRLNVNVKLHDAKNDPTRRQELADQGGKIKVPCLRIQQDGQDKWLYESKEINAYFNQCFEAK